VAHIGEDRKVYKVLEEKPKEKGPEDQGTDGRMGSE
jgi:hypothetical protein